MAGAGPPIPEVQGEQEAFALLPGQLVGSRRREREGALATGEEWRAAARVPALALRWAWTPGWVWTRASGPRCCSPLSARSSWRWALAGSALSVRVVLKGRPGPPGRLRYHVFSLALSALPLWPVGVPAELFNFVWFHYPWVFGDPGCRAYYFVREPCAYATVPSVGGPSAERFLAVRQPPRARRLLSPRRTRRLLSLLWAASPCPWQSSRGRSTSWRRLAGSRSPLRACARCW